MGQVSPLRSPNVSSTVSTRLTETQNGVVAAWAWACLFVAVLLKHTVGACALRTAQTERRVPYFISGSLPRYYTPMTQRPIHLDYIRFYNHNRRCLVYATRKAHFSRR